MNKEELKKRTKLFALIMTAIFTVSGKTAKQSEIDIPKSEIIINAT